MNHRKRPAPRALVGVYDCWSCKQEVPVKEDQDTGTLHASCPWCDFPNHAKKGTEHAKRLRAALRPAEHAAV